MDVLWQVSLVILCVAGVVLTVVRLPGTWLVVAATAACSWHFDWLRPSWRIVIALLVMAILAEGIEMMASLITARKAGASKRALWYALAGGFFGMFLFTIPLPIIGTVIGGALGCFCGAMIGEMTVQDDLRKGAKVGLFAAVGQVLGTLAKTMIALVMAGIAVCAIVLTGA